MSYFFTYRKQICTVCLGLVLCAAIRHLSIHCPSFFKVTEKKKKEGEEEEEENTQKDLPQNPVILLILPLPQCQRISGFPCTGFYGGYIPLMVTLVSVTEREQQRCLCSIPSE